MIPVNKSNFGNTIGKIRIRFHNGFGTVDGYIVRQIDSETFVATVDQTVIHIVKLAQTSATSRDLKPGFGTILVRPYPSLYQEHVRALWGKVCSTVEGNSFSWSVTEATLHNYCTIDTIGKN